MANFYPSTSGQKTIASVRSQAQDECLSKVRVPEIHDATSELQSSVERLHARLSVLEERLTSVSISIPQAEENVVRREMLSPIGSAIADRTIEVDKARARIDYLIEALAI